MSQKLHPHQDPVWSATWAWIMRQHESGGLDEAARFEFEQWLEADPAHREVYGKASQLWSLAGLIPPVNAIDSPINDGE